MLAEGTIAEFLLDLAAQNNVDADLIIGKEDSFSIQANAGKLEEQKVSTTKVIGLRIATEGKTGTASSEADDLESLRNLFDQACINARFTTANPHEGIQPLSHKLCSDDSLLCPNEADDPGERIAELFQLEAALLDQDHIQSVPYNGSRCQLVEQHIYSSAGLQAVSRHRINLIYAYALAHDGDTNAMAGKGQAGRLRSAFDVPALVRDVSAESKAMLAGKPIETGTYDIIFDNETQSDLFGAFAMCLSGKSACDGINPWRDKVGSDVASPLLRLSDCPSISDGMGYALFDAEGCCCQDRDIIADGKLLTLLHNSATAAELGAVNTANATRSAKSSLNVSGHQLCLQAGTSSDAELRGGTYLEITDLQGLHSGTNAVTGDFSLGAAGYLCRDGVRQQPVRAITVAGNFYKILMDVIAVGDSQHWNWQKSSLMPSIRFAGLTTSG